MEIPVARLLRRVAHVVPGPLLVTEYLFAVPRDYRNPGAGDVQLFARSAAKYETGVNAPSAQKQAASNQRPWMVYLQGGPGFGCPEPQDSPFTRLMISRGYSVLYLDYRGVGLSTPVTADTIPDSAADRFEYLKLFRQDNNVRDLEAVRKYLTGGLSKWSIFGQSFGGFVCLTYLSKHPEGLQEVFMTGGLAPISSTPQEVYRHTFQKVRERNVAYYKKFPEDVPVVRRITSYLWGQDNNVVQLPSGGWLSPRRLLTLGHMFGVHGGLDNVHAILLRMNMDLDQFGFLTRPTLEQIETYLNFNAAPIYAVLHEAIYCFKQGIASNWAAQKVGQELEDFRWLSHDNHGFDNPGFTADTKPLFFSGEMIFPFMLDDYPELQRMKDVAEKLALFDRWDDLYDENQLRGNTVPVYAASYIEDMYVEFGLAEETARKVQGIKTFQTNTMYHNAIRARSDEVVQQLFKLRDDTLD